MQAAQIWSKASKRPLLRPISIWNGNRQPLRYISSVPKDTYQFKSGTEKQADLQDDSKPGLRKSALRQINAPGRTRHVPTQRSQNNYDDQDVIIPSSLEETLQAHQRANKEAVIIRRAGDPVSSGTTSTGRKKSKVHNTAKHLDIAREDIQEGRGQWEDYIGKPRPLLLDWEIIGEISRNLRLPWMKELAARHNPRELAAARLSEEIRASDLFFSPSQAEWAAANQAIKQLETYVLRTDASYIKLDVIGSRASGLATSLSDLDLNLVVEPTAGEVSSKKLSGALGKLFKVMRWNNDQTFMFMTSYFAATARVPIIVGTHASGLEFQIQSANSCYGSLEVVKGLCAEYPTMKPLFKIIKQALKMRGLSDGFHGGLTSYPLINMISVSLKLHARNTDPYDVGEHLLQFLQYWSIIDLYKTGITHIPSRFLADADTASFADEDSAMSTIDLVTRDPVGAKPIEFDVRKSLKGIHEGQQNFQMTLHDPANPYNDLGRSAFAIKHIQATFVDMLAKLKQDMSDWDHQIRAEGDAGEQPPSLLRSLIEGDYSLYNMERKRLTTPREFLHEGF